MALRADDEEAAGRQRLLLGGGDLRLDLGDLPGARLRLGDLVGLARGAHLEVAAELDVGAAAGHVGGDGHRAGTPGWGWMKAVWSWKGGVSTWWLEPCCFSRAVSSSGLSGAEVTA